MPYSHLPPELILDIASFLVADYDAGLCWATYLASLHCLAWVNSWIQTSKFHAKLLTPQLYDRCLRFSPKSKTEEAKAKPWQEASWFTPVIRPCPFNDRLHQAAGHWKSDILVSYLLSRIHQGLWPLGESQEICLLTLMVKAGNVAMLETLIELGDLRGRLPELGHLETVTPLYVAILRDDSAAMRVLLDAGADVKHTNRYGQFPLHVAAEDGKSMELVEHLIQAGADIWATSTNWRRAYPVESALYAFNKHPDVARRLLGAMLETEDRAADPDWKDQVLHTAVLYNQCGSADIVQTLVDNGADVFSRCTRLEDKTAIELISLHDANPVCLDLNCCAHNEQGKIAAVMFQADARLWPLGHINRQLWECMWGVDCVETGQIMLFSLLIQSGESALDVAGPEGFEALHYLCYPAFLCRPYSGFQTHEPVSILRMVTVLLDNGASVVTRSDNGQTPLYFAAQLPWPGLLTLFLEKRPNCLIEDNAFHAKMNSSPDQTAPLLAAVQMGNLERVKMLLDHGADISIRDDYGFNALCYALDMRPIDKSLIVVLIEAILAVPERRRTWGRALSHAIGTRNREVIDMLLEAGASPWNSSIGWTALRYAAISRDAKTLGILIQRWGRTLVLSDDCRSGLLVCTVLRGKGSNSSSFTRDPELLKIAKSLVDNEAVVHQHCYACVSWKEEFGIECDMV